EEIVNIVRSSRTLEEMREELRGYHANDIAQSLELMNRAERNLLYSALDAEWMADIISYIDNPSIYIEEIGIDKLAEIINEMDADDVFD
ncbi:MAG TPA: magnesium transporter, partial [Oribacterium sp.]|nr:magnesium transporter [Oribacterium sp.]